MEHLLHLLGGILVVCIGFQTLITLDIIVGDIRAWLRRRWRRRHRQQHGQKPIDRTAHPLQSEIIHPGDAGRPAGRLAVR